MQFFAKLLAALSLMGIAIPAAYAYSTDRSSMIRTLVTTDLEQDDLASLIRYLLYTNELDNVGIIYSSSEYHWSGDGNGTKFFLPDREYSKPLWTHRWTGTRTVQDKVLKAYAEVWPNLINHDPAYPTPEDLLSQVSVGNIDFEGEMAHETEGSNIIRSLILDDDPRTLYLQAWGGTNTIARALRSIEEQYSSSSQWADIQDKVNRKAVILASGFQDETYTDYISLNWSQVRTVTYVSGYGTWGYNCNKGQGNTRGAPLNKKFFSGSWIKPSIQTGTYGKLYRSWGDGQSMPGDELDVFGNLTKSQLTVQQTCKPLGPYDFLSEGDNVVFNPLLKTGLEDPSDPTLGGWGGRANRTNSTANLWQLVSSEKAANGSTVSGYSLDRWVPDVQNDFAARMQWTLTPNYEFANHPPSVKILNGTTVKGSPGASLLLSGSVEDPDQDEVTTSWWQFFEEGTYQKNVSISSITQTKADVTVPNDAKSGQTISIVFQGTDNGTFPLTRYSRVFIEVE